jgi:hypothetical protein
MDGQSSPVRVSDLSKLTKIEDLRKLLVVIFNAPPERQRLFFRGKQVKRHECPCANSSLSNARRILCISAAQTTWST